MPGVGTYCFLGELVLTVPVEGWLEQPPGQTAADVLSLVCRHCRRCIGACPAGALSEEAGLDARRCLSYLTIEHRGPLPPATGLLMGRCLYGCDRCAEVCPYNAVAKPAAWPEFRPRPELLAMQAADWLRLTVEQYRTLFKGSAVKRAKYEGLMRNVGALLFPPMIHLQLKKARSRNREIRSLPFFLCRPFLRGAGTVCFLRVRAACCAPAAGPARLRSDATRRVPGPPAYSG